jgi:hypothetical protein
LSSGARRELEREGRGFVDRLQGEAADAVLFPTVKKANDALAVVRPHQRHEFVRDMLELGPALGHAGPIPVLDALEPAQRPVEAAIGGGEVNLVDDKAHSCPELA